MITGQAVSNVFNNDQVVAGLSKFIKLILYELNLIWLFLIINYFLPVELQGIDKQSKVGFLTLLEHLRYCQVGTYLKNPCNPIWVLGSDTHLTGIKDS